MKRASVDEPLDGLTGDPGDELEVLVVVEHDQARALCDRSDDQVWDRRGAVVTTAGQEAQYLDGSIFSDRRGVLDRHRTNRRPVESGVQVDGAASGVTNLEEARP